MARFSITFTSYAYTDHTHYHNRWNLCIMDTVIRNYTYNKKISNKVIDIMAIEDIVIEIIVKIVL